MTPETLRRSALTGSTPPAILPPLLLALWWDARGDWDRAHAIAQDGADADSAWVRAYLHRREGDLANADYWYRRAGRARPFATLDDEWAAIVTVLLGRDLTGG